MSDVLLTTLRVVSYICFSLRRHHY